MGGVAVDLFGPAVKGSHRRLLGIPSLRQMLIHRRTDMSRDGNTRLGALKARHGHKSVGAIRAHYGPQFAKGYADGETLSVVTHKLDAHGVPPAGIWKRLAVPVRNGSIVIGFDLIKERTSLS
jgi:hypothetical protein